MEGVPQPQVRGRIPKMQVPYPSIKNSPRLRLMFKPYGSFPKPGDEKSTKKHHLDAIRVKKRLAFLEIPGTQMGRAPAVLVGV